MTIFKLKSVYNIEYVFLKFSSLITKFGIAFFRENAMKKVHLRKKKPMKTYNRNRNWTEAS